MSEKHLPLCKYGKDCYRRNPEHFANFSHPDSELQSDDLTFGKRQQKPLLEEAKSKRMKITKDDEGDHGRQRNDVLVGSQSVEDTGAKAEIYGCGPSTSGSRIALELHATREDEARPSTSKLFTNLASSSNKSDEDADCMSPSSQVALSKRCSKFSYYLTYVHRGIDSSYNQGSALTLHNVLNGTKADLQSSCLFSYMYDLDWIRQQYKPADRNKPMTVVEGLKGDSHFHLLEQRGSNSNIKIVQAKLDIPYGVHHTKMIILRYSTGIRIMITTANLIPLDWFQKTQALWCSPLCPPGEGDSETNFKADLVEYLSGYRSKLLNEWVEVIQQHNMSKCRVFLIASVPGRHVGDKKSSFGHLKLRKILRQHGPGVESSSWSVIGQFSSIGKLGSNATNWLHGELLTSLSMTKGCISAGARPDMKLVFPTVENVRTSLEGYQAGGSLPFNQQSYDQQRYIKLYMHKWRSECRGRSKASPHIKSYLRLSPDNKKIPWFLMTSSNLSKAAWGMFEKQESQLMIRSYELGVLFVPKMFDMDTFTVDSTFSDDKAFPLPFDLPLTQYASADEPWIVNKKYSECDSVGERWNPYS